MSANITPAQLSYIEAATYLGVALPTLKNGIASGSLQGVTPPPFIKRGRRVYFKKSTLDNWLEQFNEVES